MRLGNSLKSILGTSFLGDTTTDRQLTWLVQIDWFGDDFLSGKTESNLIFDLETETGRAYFLNSSNDGFQPVSNPRAVIKLTDPDRRFDPYNVSSPLYDVLVPGKKARLRVIVEDGYTVEPVLVGKVTDISPYDSEEQIVTIVIDGNLDELSVEVNSPVYETIQIDDAIKELLRLANWSGPVNIDTTLSDSVTFWWANGETARSQIQNLANSALGRFFVSRDGTAVYMSRLSPDTVIEEFDASDFILSYGLKKNQTWDAVKNRIRVYAKSRKLIPNVVVWSLSGTTETPSILAGETLVLWANFSYENQEAVAKNVYNLVPGIDYEANTSSDFLGTDVTASVAISSFDKFATSAKISIKNNYNDIVYIRCQVRADIIIPDEYTFYEENDLESQGKFGIKTAIIETDWLQSINDATEYAKNLLAILKNPRIFPRGLVRMKPSKQFGLELFDLVRVNVPEKGIISEFRIGFIRHRSISRDLNFFETELYFEPSLTGNITGNWIFPATFGVTTIFG